MDTKETFIAANGALTELVLRVRPDDLGLEMPAYARFHDDQTLQTSLNIMAYENLCVPKVLAGDSGLATNPEFDGDLLGDDLAGNYDRLASEANASVRAHADLDQLVHISYGDVSAERYLSDISLNRTMTLFDVAALTGLEPHLSDEAIEAVHAIAADVGDLLRQMGIFPPEVAVSGEATREDRFRAYIGRQPRDRSMLGGDSPGGTPMTDTQKPAKAFSEDERAAMKERAKEQKAEARRGADRADGEKDVLAKIAEMPPTDRAMAERIHAIVTASAPELSPKTWYGQPAYAKDGKVICFFQASDKFKTRYATLGFSDDAHIDDGTMWPTSFGLVKLTAADEAKIAALVKKAVT